MKSFFGIKPTDEAKGSFMFGDEPIDVMKATNYSVILRGTDGTDLSLFKLDKYQLSTIKSFIKANFEDCKTRSMEIENIPVECNGEMINCKIVMVSCGHYVIVSLENDSFIYASISVTTIQGLEICNEMQKKIKEITNANFSNTMRDTLLVRG